METMNQTTTPPPPPPGGPHAPGPGPDAERLRSVTSARRSTEGRLVAGVASGVGRQLGIDPIIVRIVLVVLLYIFLFAVMKTGVGLVRGQRRDSAIWTIDVDKGPRGIRGIHVDMLGPVIEDMFVNLVGDRQDIMFLAQLGDEL